MLGRHLLRHHAAVKKTDMAHGKVYDSDKIRYSISNMKDVIVRILLL